MESGVKNSNNKANESTTSSSSSSSSNNLRLTAKPHAFAGAVLSPKHARDLTPSQCLAIAAALSEGTSVNRKTNVPYTLWITEAWRVLGWAEPSAALFWEMATMYHTLFLASRDFAAEFREGTNIPPILSCGSTSSMGSGTNNSLTDSTNRPATIDKRRVTASAKELPVWLVGSFLLLHCEEFAYQRNLSGEDDQRFFGSNSFAIESGLNAGRMNINHIFQHSSALSPRTQLHAGWNNENTHCTAYLLRHLRKFLVMMAGPHNTDAVRACMHLAAIPTLSSAQQQQQRALRQQQQQQQQHPGGSPNSQIMGSSSFEGRHYSAQELRRQHDEEHGNVGLGVRLTLDDLERLNLLLQLPSGGGIDDPPVKIGDLIWNALFQSPVHPGASILLGDVEQEVRQHLELELAMAELKKDETRKDGGASEKKESALKALTRLSLNSSSSASATSSNKAVVDDKARPLNKQCLKELTYSHLRGTTIVLKSNASPETSSGASTGSGEPNFVGSLSSSARLHDLSVSNCSDANLYLLQPFEHATIAACTGCTIVIGAVAGLLHVVDCEKTTITTASRRILVSNSADVQIYMFSPSPPLLVGDNRTCQFAPYNTYYDGLREDLLQTGLAAACVPENQSPYHGNKAIENDGAWPPLQCATNKWKQPVELSKLEVPQVPNSPAGSSLSSSPTATPPGADDKAMGKGSGNDATMHTPILLPASEFHITFVPVESEAARVRRIEAEEHEASGDSSGGGGGALESQYCRLLAEVLHLSPFRLPVEYERRALLKAERMRNIQQAVQKNLTPEEQGRFEEELNQEFREWLATSGNLRQILDLVHLERRETT